MPDELGALLLRCEIGERTGARAAARAEAIRRFAGPTRPTQARARWLRRPLALAAGALVLLVGFCFTPPGAAIAEQVGDWVGIGDEPSDPYGFSDRPGWTGYGPRVDSSDAVIGTGTTPSGIRFELAENTSRVQDPAQSDPGSSCVYLSFPDADLRSGVASCLTDAALRGFERGGALQSFPYLGPDGLGKSEDLIVALQGAPDVARVEVSYPDEDGEHTVEATLAPFVAAPAQPPEKIAAGAATREPTPLVAGVAFLPSTIFRRLPPHVQTKRFTRDRTSTLDLKLDYQAASKLLREIRVTAYDEDGNVLISRDLMRAWTSSIGLAATIPPDE